MQSRPDDAAAVGVRLAAAHDLYAAHAFLPWIATAAVPLNAIFVAHDRDRLCGAAALSTIPVGDSLRADIFVHPQDRRRGLGSRLLAPLADAARAWGAARLRTWRPTDDAGATAFLGHARAVPASRLLTFEVSADQCINLCWRLGPKVATVAGKAVVRSLGEADLPAIASFYAMHLGDALAVAVHRLRAVLADTAFQELSVGVESEGVLRGFAIFRADDDGMPRLDFWYVDPCMRGVSALALIVAAFRRSLPAGRRSVRFQCRDDARHTLRMAREMGALPVRTEVLHELAL